MIKFPIIWEFFYINYLFFKKIVVLYTTWKKKGHTKTGVKIIVF